ncbi:MAG: hypothetical protein CL735_05565 [Chloroflexi bacterium]|jgi:hypothetical protein|nr:hypothetical protein [Chloroflexota bacterium]|tara:strand:- start:250 stop:1302 length:1053 start_codon:yes stop_codon:yes gene_type:complete
MKARFLGLLLSCVFLVIGSAIMVYSLYFFEVCQPDPDRSWEQIPEGKLCATGGIGNNTSDAWHEDLDRAGAIFGSGLVIFLSALLTIIFIKWKSDISEEPKFAIKLAYASIGLSLISLFLHFMGHGWLNTWWWGQPAFNWDGEEIPVFKCYVNNVFFKGLLGFPASGCFLIPKWHYLDVLSFPIVLGSILIYFYKEDSPDPDMKKIAAKVIIFLVIIKLFLSFLPGDYSIYMPSLWSVKFLFLLEIIFILFFLVFAVGMIRGVNSNISNFIIPSILLLNAIYIILKIYASVWIDYHSGIIWTSFWGNDFIQPTWYYLHYKMYAILELIIRPLFYYSMACLYVYREENPWY